MQHVILTIVSGLQDKDSCNLTYDFWCEQYSINHAWTESKTIHIVSASRDQLMQQSFHLTCRIFLWTNASKNSEQSVVRSMLAIQEKKVY